MLEVHYQNTEEDLRRAAWGLPWRLWLPRSATFWGMMFLAALPASLLLAALGNVRALVGGWGFWCLLVGGLWYRMWANQQRAIAAAALRQGLTTTRISPEWIEVTSERYKIRSAWSEMKHVIVTPKQILMVSKTRVLHVLPRRAFPSLAAAETFAQAAIDYQQAAQHSNVPEMAPVVPAVMSDDAMQVCYRNEVEELVSFEFDGLRKPGQPPDNTMTWRGAIGFFVIGIALAVYGSLKIEPGAWNAIARAVLGSVGMILSGVGMLVAIKSLLRRMSRAEYENWCRTDQFMTISRAGVAVDEGSTQSLGRWTEYSSVEEDERFIALFQNQRTHLAHLIPKRAFADTTEAERFYSLAWQYWQMVQPPPEAPADSGNPYQSPAAGRA